MIRAELKLASVQGNNRMPENPCAWERIWEPKQNLNALTLFVGSQASNPLILRLSPSKKSIALPTELRAGIVVSLWNSKASQNPI